MLATDAIFIFSVSPWVGTINPLSILYLVCFLVATLQVKVPVLKHLNTTPCRRMREWRYSSTLALDGGEWSASSPDRFTTEETTSDAHWIGNWVGSRIGLNTVDMRQILQCRESKPDRPAHRPPLYRLNYRAPNLPCSFTIKSYLRLSVFTHSTYIVFSFESLQLILLIISFSYILIFCFA
jgi:hypothetical protein